MLILRCIFCSLLSGILFTLTVGLLHGQSLPEISSPSSPSAPSAAAPRKKIVYREKSYFEFEDTLINGNLRAPDGSFIFRKNQSTFSSALNLRRSFIPELKQSSDDGR